MQTMSVPCTCGQTSVVANDEAKIVAFRDLSGAMTKASVTWTCTFCNVTHYTMLDGRAYIMLTMADVAVIEITQDAEWEQARSIALPPITEDDMIAFGLALSKIATPTEALV